MRAEQCCAGYHDRWMENERNRWRAIILAALAAGLLLRLWFLRHAPAVSGDGLVYGGIAKNWLTRGVYGFDTDGGGFVSPTLIRLPGYPIFLAVCFKLFGVERYSAIRYLQVLTDLITCAFCAATARRLLGKRAGLATLCLAAFCPFTADYAPAILTECLVLLTIAVAFYAFLRWHQAGAAFNRWLWLLSASLAASLLLRPEQGLLAASILPAMAWVLWRKHRSLGPVLACAACVLIPLVPWTVRNWRSFHVFQPLAPRYANDPGESPPLGFARWYRTWAIDFSSTDQVYWNYNTDRIDPNMLPERAFDSGSPVETDRVRRQTLELLNTYNQSAVQTPATEAGFAALAKQRIRSHPLRYYIGLPLARLADMALRPRTEMMAIPLEWWRWRGHLRTSLMAVGYAALNLFYLALAIAGFLKWRRSRFAPDPPLAWAMIATVTLRCILLLTIDNSEPRYTLEFFPVVFIGAAAVFAKRLASSHRTAPDQPGRPLGETPQLETTL